MDIPKNKWDVERAAAWLRKHTWGPAGEERPDDLDDDLVSAAADAESETIEVEDDEIDIACWPALVAPFYD